MNYIKKERKPNINILNEVLSFDSPITRSHFNLCKSIIKKVVTLNLPVSHTKEVAIFSKIAGIENLESLRKSGKYVPGCYRIWDLGTSTNLCYIGQTKHLGSRIKYHAKGYNKSTREFCSGFKNRIKVDLFILPDKQKISGLSLNEFLCVLEQYLIFKYRPELNKLYIARPGLVWTKDVIAKHRDKVGKKVYIYIKSEERKDSLEYIYTCDSGSYGSILLGKERSWIKNIIARNKGWYRDILYFSLFSLNELKVENNLYNIINNLKDKDKVKLYIENRLSLISNRKGKKVKITDTIKNEIQIYRSKREAARNLKADPSSMYNRDKLFRGIYKIEILD